MESAAFNVAGLDSLRVGSPGEARAQVVLLHGYDMRPEDLEPFSQSLNLPMLFHFPRGPERSPSGNRCWWPIDQERRAKQLQSGPRDLCEESPPGRPAARQALSGFLDELRAQHPKLPLVLGGFSQGGMLACDTVLCARQAVSGLILLSSSRIAFDDWQANREALTDMPVMVSHGTRDADLAFSAGESLRDFCRNSGARVTWQAFEGGHEIPLVVWRALRRFLAELSRKSD
jgi:phospholipase/carboxylesterase